jgi:hypothetical protein
MTRFILVAIVLAFGAPLLAGCAGQGQGAAYPGYRTSPGDPNCGVLGDCQPSRDRPYDMHGNYGGG